MLCSFLHCSKMRYHRKHGVTQRLQLLCTGYRANVSPVGWLQACKWHGIVLKATTEPNRSVIFVPLCSICPIRIILRQIRARQGRPSEEFEGLWVQYKSPLSEVYIDGSGRPQSTTGHVSQVISAYKVMISPILSFPLLPLAFVM